MIGAKWGVRENELGNKHPATKKEGEGGKQMLAGNVPFVFRQIGNWGPFFVIHGMTSQCDPSCRHDREDKQKKNSRGFHPEPSWHWQECWKIWDMDKKNSSCGKSNLWVTLKAPKKAHYYCMTPFEFHSFGEKHISTANISSQWLHQQQQVRNLGKRCRRRWKLLILMPPLIMVISLISYVMFFSRVTQHVICLYTMYITGNSTHTCHPFVNRPAWLVYIEQKGLDPIIECLVSCTGVEH